jgi:DNA-binding response OmpR family regulator
VESLGKIFERENISAMTANAGAAGLEILRRHRVGVLLTDLMMPGMSGMDLLKAARTVAPSFAVIALMFSRSKIFPSDSTIPFSSSTIRTIGCGAGPGVEWFGS